MTVRAAPRKLTLDFSPKEPIEQQFLRHTAVRQIGNGLCWAACIECISIMYPPPTPEEPWTQGRVAQKSIDSCEVVPSAPLPDTDPCNRLLVGDMAELWRDVGFREVSGHKIVDLRTSEAFIRQEIKAGRPVQIEEEGAHVVLVMGYRRYKDVLGEVCMYLLMDPEVAPSSRFPLRRTPRRGWHVTTFRPPWTAMWSGFAKG